MSMSNRADHGVNLAGLAIHRTDTVDILEIDLDRSPLLRPTLITS